MSDSIRVLFVCVHNAARSRIAEAFLRNLGAGRFNVVSAGFEPQRTNPLVIEALQLARLHLPNSEVQPSVFDLYRAGRQFDYVISVCDEAHSEKCPIFPGVTKRLSWSFPDPSTFEGSHAARLARVIEVRDAIRDRVVEWIGQLSDPRPDISAASHDAA